ncbi:hypothetical protein K501DRAFT_320626 [Backusella circina FSU 941]|nr:hypothetical protein K501DRAFT_320626 [Backusella circina FSU 941]
MNISVYKRRRLRSTQPILTRVQIRDLGRMRGMTSFRQMVEFFMDPFNYFKLTKAEMINIHKYLIEKNLTTEKCPNTNFFQNDMSRLLISILFPGYPIKKANDQHYREFRENRRQAKTPALAYDRLPTTDKYERLEEMHYTEVDWYRTTAKRYSVEIPRKKCNRAAVAEGHALSNKNVRLFMYIWTSENMAWSPDIHQMFVNDDDHENCFKEKQKKVFEDGFKHIDITDMSELILSANRRSPGDVKFTFEFNNIDFPKACYVSVCTVAEKSTEELTSQLYLQTASLYIGQAMEKSSRNIPLADQVQKKVMERLNKYTLNDRNVLAKTEELFLSCGDAFFSYWKDTTEEEDGDDDIFIAEERISMLDPILVKRIEHPARSVFCTHKTCFDAEVFFKCKIIALLWQCPLCLVRINGIQDLYIDYPTKTGLIKYPGEDQLILEKDGSYSSSGPIIYHDEIDDTKHLKRPVYQVITIKDEEARDDTELESKDTKRIKLEEDSIHQASHVS